MESLNLFDLAKEHSGKGSGADFVMDQRYRFPPFSGGILPRQPVFAAQLGDQGIVVQVAGDE